MDIWNHEDSISALGIDVPRWIDQDIPGNTIAAITQGGCASGAYMPAVTYHQALATMSEHGDDVLAFIDDSTGEVPAMPETAPAYGTWSGMACFYLSYAVELWAAGVEEEIIDKLADLDEETE